MSTGFEDNDELLAAFLREEGEAALGGGGEAHLWKAGREVGEWVVTGFLARGGSAETYCAKHRRLGTAAALKVLWRGEPGPRARFDRETAFLMGNPGEAFPAFYGAGVEEGRPWVAMELLDECPLPGTDAGAARYLEDVGHGVAALHARGWIHRDLKPRNILRRADGRAVLVDFGLLKAIGTNETTVERVSPSVVDGREVGVGTPGYAAPEQFAGGAATPASDVHALGMLADECFGGKPPRAWERIIRRATGSLPRQRYADAAAMARAIRRRFWPRNAAWAVLAAALVAAAAVWRGAGKKPEIPETPETPEVPESAAAPAAVPRKSVREERAAALARFEADEGQKEAILGLVDGMQRMGLARAGRHEVTQGQWEALMDENPSRFRGEDLPVDSLTVGACLEFIERLNATSIAKQEDLRFRLPSASEWQAVAAKVASRTPEERLASGWFAENAGGRTHPVGEKQGSGLCPDVYGNVRELTRSWGKADGKEGFRCMGGSWADPAAGEGVAEALLEQPRFMWYWDRLASADTVPSDYPNAVCPAPGEIGFRLWAEVRTPPEEPSFPDGDSSDDARDDGGWEIR